MKFTGTISKELSDILRACTTVKQRDAVATKHQISIHTINSLLEGKRKVNKNNKQCIIELLKMSIQNARDMHYSLMDYYQEIKYL